MSRTDDPRETHAGEKCAVPGCWIQARYCPVHVQPTVPTPDPTTPAALPVQPDTHPEDHCHRCGGPNVIWSAPSPLWNEVMRGGDINGPWQFDEIICPTCFAVLAESAGIAFRWRMAADDVRRELQTTTPSGRTWNAKTLLWDEADLAAARAEVVALRADSARLAGGQGDRKSAS